MPGSQRDKKYATWELATRNGWSNAEALRFLNEKLPSTPGMQRDLATAWRERRRRMGIEDATEDAEVAAALANFRLK